MSEPINFADFVLPVIIERADDYNPRAAKAKFERLAFMLAKQAFWLQIFEILEKRSDDVEAVSFTQSNEADKMMLMVAKPGANETKVSGAHKALSKARGKFGSGNWSAMRHHIASVVPKNGSVTLADRETVLHRALGEDLYGLRKSTLESQELDAELNAAAISALSGRPRASRL